MRLTWFPLVAQRSVLELRLFERWQTHLLVDMSYLWLSGCQEKIAYVKREGGDGRTLYCTLMNVII